MYEEYERLQPLLEADEPIKPLSSEQKKSFFNSKNCYLCNERFQNTKHLKKVRDHCHYTGSYIGAAHSRCNLERQMDTRLPIVFHNFR